jgi:hypothetical protein
MKSQAPPAGRVVGASVESPGRTFNDGSVNPTDDPMQRTDPFGDRRRVADPARTRLEKSRFTIEQRLTTAAKTFEAVLASTAKSMELWAKSLSLLGRPVYRPPLIARPLDAATEQNQDCRKARPRRPGDRRSKP